MSVVFLTNQWECKKFDFIVNIFAGYGHSSLQVSVYHGNRVGQNEIPQKILNRIILV